jgi:predicted HAD superfamily Cof-like phosphohydrolase
MADQRFYEDIKKFNAIYKLESNTSPTLLGAQRVHQFHNILSEEVEEGLELVSKYEGLLEAQGAELPNEARLNLLTEMSDWLGDIIVYCASEARRWGIPLDQVLRVIMESNFSKLDRNGQPIYDNRGKVMKGPDYWKPEPKIREILADLASNQT